MGKRQKPAQGFFRSKRNSIFICIQDNGFDPSDFILSEENTQNDFARLLMIRHSRSRDLRFTISHNLLSDNYEVRFSPGLSYRNREILAVLSWPIVLDKLKVWLNLLIEEIRTPDLWSTISGGTQLIKLAADQDNRPFTLDEQNQIKKTLDEIKTYLIKSNNLTEAQIRIVEARFDYMDEAAGRLGRKDWTGIFVSSLIGIAATLTLSADSAKDLIRFAGQIVKQFLGTILYLAGPH